MDKLRSIIFPVHMQSLELKHLCQRSTLFWKFFFICATKESIGPASLSCKQINLFGIVLFKTL